MLDLGLPLRDPGSPDAVTPVRLLLWVGRLQLRLLLVAMSFGIVWMTTQALMPFTVGRGIDEGIVGGDHAALARWSLLLLGLGATQAVAGTLRHRYAVQNWLLASFRLVQIIGRHVARGGPAIRAAHSTGEVVATVSNDALRAGGAFDVTARLSGAIVSYVVVAVILLTSSAVLGLLVLIGVPVLVLLLGGVIRPLQLRQRKQRDEVGLLTALGADTAAGLRVLRGIGGEETFLERYRTQSERVRTAGVRVATPQATIDAAQVFLPGLFVVLVTWIGARLVLDGTLAPGELVAFYGYAAFLVIPLRTAAEAVERMTRAVVGARRMLDVLAVERQVDDPEEPAVPPPTPATLADNRSALTLSPGELVCLVSAVPEETAAIADRLGRFVPDAGVTFGGVPLARLQLAEVRRRILVSDADPILFSGTLRSELDPTRRTVDDGAILAAIEVADAADIVEALPGGLDGEVEERGRSFSGGQRQRLVLARAVVADPEILVLVEPTSAVDAHTEARIASRLLEARRGRTTAVITTSPLMLERADRVAWIVAGVVRETGTHHELLGRCPDYAETVTRGEAG
ncbi:MAG: ABC transporter ATP-binding protein [Gaiellales bacterium]